MTIVSRATVFTGYDLLRQSTVVLDIQTVGDKAFVRLAESPFYAERGGQSSDTGQLLNPAGSCVATVLDVKSESSGQILEVLFKDTKNSDLQSGDAVVAVVDHARRFATTCHHTAAHLFFAAVRELFGEDIRQAGCSIKPEKFRFDIKTKQSFTPKEVNQIEDCVNQWICEDHSITTRVVDLGQAKELGAGMMDDERYESQVRMVEVAGGLISRELCGGTHAETTGEIGSFVITGTSSVGGGARRFEILAGPAAGRYLLQQNRVVRDLSAHLQVAPNALFERVVKLQTTRKQPAGQATVDINELIREAKQVGEITLLVKALEGVEGKDLRKLTEAALIALDESSIVAFGITENGRSKLVVGVTDKAVAAGCSATTFVQEFSEQLGAKGGGNDRVAQVGSNESGFLQKAFALTIKILQDAMRK